MSEENKAGEAPQPQAPQPEPIPEQPSLTGEPTDWNLAKGGADRIPSNINKLWRQRGNGGNE